MISIEIFKKVKNNISEDLKPIMADILARIGFTLYTIRLKLQEEKLPDEFFEESIYEKKIQQTKEILIASSDSEFKTGL